MPPHPLASLRPRHRAWTFALLALSQGCGRLGVELLPSPLTVDNGAAATPEDAGAQPDADPSAGAGMGNGAAIDPCLTACFNNHGSAQCVDGRCILGCSPGYTDCDGDGRNGCETNFASDPSHCGSCSRVCDLNSEVCENGSCERSPCPPGRAECDDDVTQLCETDLTSSPASCGFCGNACTAAHGQATCRERSCVITSCDPGYDDCDGLPENGCETSLNSAAACGACGRSCPANEGTPSCSAGMCTVTCQLAGTYAVKLSIPATWPGTIALSAGSGDFAFWGLLQLAQADADLTGTFTPCGELVPDFSAAPLINERYGLIFPNALFDRTPLLPGVAARVSVSAAAPGASLSLPRTAYLLGAALADPTGGVWPTPSGTATVDGDGDGKPGLSVPYKSGVGYTAPPVNNLGSFRAERAYLATRVVFSLNGTLDSCSRSTGQVAAQDIEANTLGCRMLGSGRDCLTLEGAHLDQNTPDFRPSAGTYAMVKVEQASCAAVRAALP